MHERSRTEGKENLSSADKFSRQNTNTNILDSSKEPWNVDGFKCFLVGIRQSLK